MAEPARPAPPDVQRMSADEFQRLYGPWASPNPSGLVAVFGGASFPWWISGGWSLEADDQPRREHEDIDVGLLARDVDAVRAWLDGFHLWEAHAGTLRPLLAGEPMSEGREQLWVRRDAYSPWLLDLVFSPGDADTWIYKRDHRIRLPFADAVRARGDGVPVQAPEITLLFKAKLARAKDEADLAAVLPALDVRARDWLREALELSEPDHPWLSQF